MKCYLVLLVAFLLLISCKEKTEDRQPDREFVGDSLVNETTEEPKLTKDYVSEKWHFTLQFPAGYRVTEEELPGQTPVVNIYDSENEKAPPFAIHESAEASYIAFLPEGFGVDAPSGTRKSFKKWERSLPLSFEIDPDNSTVYLLENGQPWAASIRFYSPPPGWKELGSIFVHYAVNDFQAECFAEASGSKKAMKDCDPLGGDQVKYYGEVSAESKEALNNVLESLYFSSENDQRREISELISVEQPVPNATIESPLKITGKARGYWYFEGEAPFKLVNKDYKTLATGSLKAQGEWMTEESVPFEGEVTFKAPKDERGYLIFSRSNASGKPEHDRTYRIPVIFPPKNAN